MCSSGQLDSRRRQRFTSESSTKGGDGIRLVLGVVAATTVGFMGVNLQPMLLGAMIDGLGLSTDQAGLAASVEPAAIAVVSLLIAPRVGSLSRRALALVGVGITILGYAASAVAPSYGFLVIARIMAGLGEGAVLAAGTAAAAAALDPDRVWAFVVILGGVAAAFLIGAIPYAISPWGYVGAFGTLAIVCLVSAPLLILLPPTPPKAALNEGSRLPRFTLAVLTLLAILLMQIGESGLWAFSERLGVDVDLSTEAVGLVLGGATLFGVVGAAAAALLSTRLGRAAPLVVGFVLSIVSRCAVVYSTTAGMYTASQFVWGFSYLFLLPYLLGTVAVLDRLGRWSAAAAAAMTIGLAIAPGACGLLVSHFGYGALGLLMGVTGVVALALVLPVALSIEREAVNGGGPE